MQDFGEKVNAGECFSGRFDYFAVALTVSTVVGIQIKLRKEDILVRRLKPKIRWWFPVVASLR